MIAMPTVQRLTSFKVGAVEIEGVDMIGLDSDGKVESLAIHLRPLPAVVLLQNHLAPAIGVPVLTLTTETGV